MKTRTLKLTKVEGRELLLHLWNARDKVNIIVLSIILAKVEKAFPEVDHEAEVES